MPEDATSLGVPTRYCSKCGSDFVPKRSNQQYCKPEHRPPNYTLRLTAAQAALILEIASRLRPD